ncbi:hypothetical protein [Streptomyces sp.]|uniref:hypothetical protein n=1 Tax=Streptomyces sp. TaxID=1931 RepID=UPI002F92DE2D
MTQPLPDYITVSTVELLGIAQDAAALLHRIADATDGRATLITSPTLRSLPAGVADFASYRARRLAVS